MSRIDDLIAQAKASQSPEKFAEQLENVASSFLYTARNLKRQKEDGLVLAIIAERMGMFADQLTADARAIEEG